MLPINLIGKDGKLQVVNGRRVKLITSPGKYDHRKIRKIADKKPFYLVEDRYGNQGLYQLDQMKLA